LTWELLIPVVAFLAATIRLTVPIVLPALGELYSEYSGIFNIELEGMMLMGAFTGFMGTYYSGSYLLGILLGIAGGGIIGLIMAFFSVTLKVDQVITGIALNVIAISITSYFYLATSTLSQFPPLPSIGVPILSQIPIIGSLFQQSVYVYLLIPLIPLLSVVLFRSNIGLKIRAVGENPRAADTFGIHVFRTRYACVIFAGLMAGLGGTVITLGEFGMFLLQITGGRGWLAVTCCVVGNLKPAKTLGIALAFGAADAFRLRLQAMGLVQIPIEFGMVLPYVFCILALCVLALMGKARSPAAMMTPYSRE
jgi:ABC-type uncharacterized transport system permease subunit